MFLKKISLLITCLISTALLAQSDTLVVFKNKDGAIVSGASGAATIEKQIYTNKRTGAGIVTATDTGGRLLWRCPYSSLRGMTRHGICTTYNADGSVNYTDEYINGKRSGKIKFYGKDDVPTLSGDSAVYTFVHEEPKFDSLWKYLNLNLRFPYDYVGDGEKQSISVSFIVEKDGSISDIVFMESIAPMADKSVYDLLTGMPAWTPAKYIGKIVRCRHILRKVVTVY